MQKRSPARRMTYREWKIRKCLRLARNWVLFLAACGGAVALMATGILWLLPKAHALIAGPVPFTARNYDSSSYVFDAADDRLVVVNANLALEEEPAPELAVADDATGEQLELMFHRDQTPFFLLARIPSGLRRITRINSTK